MKAPIELLFNRLTAAVLVVLMISCGAPDEKQEKAFEPLNLDLSKPEDNLTAFVKMRASLDENEETTYWWKGSIWSMVPGERSRKLFDMEAYNIAKIRKVEGGYEMLTREVAIYLDPETGEILEEWENPWTGKKVDVLHVWNDPVNQQFMLEGRFGPWGVPYNKMYNGTIVMNSDIFLLYPSVLPKTEYPLNSRSDMYQAAELFQFFFSEEDMNNPNLTNIDANISWTRISDFLPWMEMADLPGQLVYHCRGHKLPNSYADLPAYLREYVERKFPQFASAPDEFVTPNETSWTYFKKYKAGQVSK